MSEPTVVINIYNGSSPCNCGEKSALPSFSGGKAKEPPGDADPPCSSCTWSMPQNNVIQLEGTLAERATGGYPISNAALRLYDEKGALVSAVPLTAVEAGDPVVGTYSMITESVAKAVFSYTADDGSVHKHDITPKTGE